MNAPGLSRFLQSAIAVAGSQTPQVLARFARMTYANRTSRMRPAKRVPPAAISCPSNCRPADIVIPVYNNYDDTAKLLEALAGDIDLGGRIIIVHDASTDERIAPLLQSYATRLRNCKVLENAKNLGFVLTCNRAFAHTANDIVILNTDIDLPRGGLSRMIGHLQSDPAIATVTPFSNSAYGTGFPHLVYTGPLAFGATAEDIDEVFASLRPTAAVDLATGVGFCMAISRSALDRLRGFDVHFGQGYGEETDFCQRSRALGLRNVLAPNVFVAHKGGQSFGGGWQEKSRRGLLKVHHRYPDYARSVASYLDCSEAMTLNVAASIALAERLSQRKALFHEGARGGAVESGAPVVSLLPHRRHWVARVSLQGETHTYHLAAPEMFDQALRLLPSSSQAAKEQVV